MLKFFWRLIRPATHAKRLQGWLDFTPIGGGAIVAAVTFIFGLPALWAAVVILSIVALWVGIGAFSLFLENEAYRDRPTPNVVLDGFSPVRYQSVQPADVSEDPRAEFARIRFVNEPARRGPEADIQNLHAHIEILDQNEKVVLSVPDGRWADNVDRGEAPSRDTKSTDLPCTGESRVLDIVMQRLGQASCYGWDHNGFQMRRTPIPEGLYRVTVELAASNLPSTELFEFELRNNGTADHLDLVESKSSKNPSSRRWLATKQSTPDIAVGDPSPTG